MSDSEQQQSLEAADVSPKPSTINEADQEPNSSSSFVKRLFKRCKAQKEPPQDRCSSQVEDQDTHQPQHQQHQQQHQQHQQQQHQQQDDASSPPLLQLPAENTLVSLSNCLGSKGCEVVNDCIAELTEPAASHNTEENETPDLAATTEGDQTGGADSSKAPTGDEGNTEEGQKSATAPNAQTKTRAQIFRANEAAARKRAEKYWTVDSEAYNFKDALNHYTNVDKHIKPKEMKFIVDHREKQLCDDYGKVMRTIIRGAIHPLIDRVVTGFCQRMGMSEAQKVPTVEERMFLWFSRERALKLISRMGPKQQVYFLNFITWDNVLTDLQCLNSRLRHCSMAEGQTYTEHYCHDADKIREVFTTKFNAKPDTPVPKMLFVDKQFLCSHVYNTQEFNTPCEEKDCPNFGKRMCRCFQNNLFVPESMVLATKTQFERVMKNFIDDKYFNQRWMIRAANLKSGNGVQFIDSASELETFLRYDIRRKLRGQFFIMQRYIRNPMLMELRRFDCRMFLLICVLTDRRVLGFLHPGYTREAQKDYDPASNDLRCHFTLPFTWDPDYNRYKGNKPEELPDYCKPFTEVCEGLELPKLDVRTVDDELRSGNHFISKINCIVQEVVRSMESIVHEKPGTWQLFGLDITIDNDKNPWLYEIITYPCSGEPDFFSETQNRMLPAVLTEALTITFELNQRDFATRSRLEWMDLPDIPWNKPGLITAQQNFVWLYSTSPDRLVSYKEVYRIPRLHWYHQWRVTEDFNDYILYLKNFRIDSIVRVADNNIYGRRTFDNSTVFKLKQQLKKAGFKPPQTQ